MELGTHLAGRLEIARIDWIRLSSEYRKAAVWQPFSIPKASALGLASAGAGHRHRADDFADDGAGIDML